MSKNYELKEQLLQDSETELLLKNYLSKIDLFMGEDFAVETMSSKTDIVKSLNEYTYTFEGKDSIEIAFILLKSAVLSNEKNIIVKSIKEKVKYGDLRDALDLVNHSIEVRGNLTRNLIHQSKKTDKELYNSLNEKNHIIEDLDNLKFYEHIVNEREKEFKLLKSR